MANSKSWWSGEEAPWEGRIVIVINLIQNIEVCSQNHEQVCTPSMIWLNLPVFQTKLQQTLEVLKKASVPWSSTMTTLAEENGNLDYALASQIRIEYNSVPIKLILKKYGYERIGINDVSKYYFLRPICYILQSNLKSSLFLKRLICRIIKENHSEMISHIQQITKNDPVLRKYAFSSLTNYYLSRG